MTNEDTTNMHFIRLVLMYSLCFQANCDDLPISSATEQNGTGRRLFEIHKSSTEQTRMDNEFIQLQKSSTEQYDIDRELLRIQNEAIASFVPPAIDFVDTAELIWDYEKETAAHLQGRVCSERCYRGQKVNFVKDNRCLECFPCSCDPQCVKYGTCCPQISLDDVWQPPPVERAHCTVTDYGFVLTVAACDPAYPDDHTRFLCESKSSPRRRDTFLTVTSLSTGVSYANVHCAVCNHENSSFTMDWIITSVHNQYLYTAINDTEYDQRAILMPELCKTAPESPNLLENGGYCYPLPYTESLVSTCNVTGRWQDHDEHVRKACEESDRSRGAMVIMEQSRYYANVFCAMCNENASKLALDCETRIVIDQRTQFSVQVRTHTGLFDQSFFNPNTFRDMTCPRQQWKHPEEGCQDLQCAAGKLLTPQRTCKTALDRVVGLGYHLKVMLRPVVLTYEMDDATMTSTTFSTSSSSTTISSTLSSQTSSTPATATSTTDPYSSDMSTFIPLFKSFDVAVSFEIEHGCDYINNIKESVNKAFRYISVDQSMNITASHVPDGACFDEVYQAQWNKLMNHPNVTIQVVKPGVKQMELVIGEYMQSDASFLDAFVEADIIATNIVRDDFEEESIAKIFNREWTIYINKWTVKMKAFDLTSGFYPHAKEIAANNGFDVDTFSFPYHEQFGDDKHPLIGLEHLFLPFSNRFMCPHLRFDGDLFEVKNSDLTVRVQFPFYLLSDGKPVSFDVQAYPFGVWLEDDQHLVMCFTTYDEVFPQNVTIDRTEAGESLTRKIMNLVCSTISILCLVLIVLTYALFSQLRTLPGLNNMALATSLATAQLSLLIPWHRTGNAVVCSVVGVVTHWLWMMALLWMGVCCVHMVYVFASKTRHILSLREVKKAFLRNILFTVLTSVAIVVLTMSVAAGVSGGSSIGYGGSQCFLDTSVHRLLVLAFMLPLGLVVSTNLLCFTFTVVAIMRVRELQTNTVRDRREILVYVKLVTVTGGAWLLAVLADIVHQEWMLVVAELCTAMQGLLLFLSYVCNERVWRLYRARFCPSPPSTTTTTSTNTGVTSSFRGTKAGHSDV